MNYKRTVLILFGCQAFGQWSWSGQLRTRSECRDGARTLRLNTYALHKSNMLEFGYSMMHAADSMKYAKALAPGTAQKQAT